MFRLQVSYPIAWVLLIIDVRSDKHHLEAAQCWLTLGNWKEANEEMEQITAQMRAHPDVLGHSLGK